jgi:hypothetical protein
MQSCRRGKHYSRNPKPVSMLNHKPFEQFIERQFNPGIEPESLKDRLITEIYNVAFQSGSMLSLPINQALGIIERETQTLPGELQLKLDKWIKREIQRYIVMESTYALTESELHNLITRAIREINR